MQKPTLPNYQRIKDALLQEIGAGTYRPDELFITQQEVCQRFHVSRITAERALNELVRDGILVRRRGQGTFVVEPPSSPSSETAPDAPLFPATQKVIACIISVTRSDHKNEIISGVNHICRETDCHLLFFDSAESASIEAANLQRAIKAGVAGIIIYPVDGHQNHDLFKTILQQGIPLIMVDRYDPTLATDAVVPDNVATGYMLTKALIEQGHSILGTIWQEVDCTSVQERLMGYKQAIQEAHLQIQSDLATLRSYSALREEERRTLLAGWLSLPTPPTALLAANSHLLGMVSLDLLKMGVQIGKEVILASMDKDDPGVPLTFGSPSVLLPSYEMGCQAMQMLLNRLQNAGAPAQHRVLAVKLAPSNSFVINAQVASAD